MCFKLCLFFVLIQYFGGPLESNGKEYPLDNYNHNLRNSYDYPHGFHDPEQPVSYQWRGYGYQSRNQPEFFHSSAIPYRLWPGILPRQKRPYGSCRPIQLYMVFRHAERNPGISEGFMERSLDPLMNIVNLLIREKSTGISPSVDVKFPWKNPYLKKEYMLQVPAGDKQLYEIGRRYAKRFPEILDEFSIADLNFTASCASRAQQSATAFGMGYLQGKGHVTKKHLQPIPLTTYPCIGDRFHYPQRGCQKWQETVATNPATLLEHNKFVTSERYQKIVKKVRQKLGLKRIKEIDQKLVHLMFSACSWGVEKFGFSQNSRWCSLFSVEDQKVFDYSMDSFFYYSIGPGNQVNIDVGCPLLKDILTNLQLMARKTSGSQPRKIIARFGHITTLLPAIHKLGLFIDKVPLLATNYEQMRNREFKMGKIGPMSGNFAFVLYKCSTCGKREIYKIQFYLNEMLVKLPACRSKVSCSLDQFVRYYKPILDKCSYEEACKV